jgi:hypothetical protein
MKAQSRIVHVLLTEGFFPELCELTLPTIERWTQKIGAQLNIISRRRWPEWPILTEKLQVWYDGANADWNILLDADILVHPDTPDMLGTFVPIDCVGAKDAYHADTQLKMDENFIKDGRNIGLSGCAIATSRHCHNLWRPLPEEMSLFQACENILNPRKIVDEYCISRNMARYGYKLHAILDPVTQYDRLFHLGTFGQDQNRILDEARRWRAKYWK